MKAILSLYRPEVDLMRNPKIARLLVLCALLASLSACGSKGPLVLPSEEPAKPEPAAT